MNDWEAPSSDGSKETLTCLSRAGEAQLDGGRRWVIEGERRHPHQMSRARHTWQRLPEAGGVGGPCVHKPNANTGGPAQSHTHTYTDAHTDTHMQSVWGLKRCHWLLSLWILHEQPSGHETPTYRRVVAIGTAPSILTHFDIVKQSPKQAHTHAHTHARRQSQAGTTRQTRRAARCSLSMRLSRRRAQVVVVLLNKVKCHQNQKENATYA